MKLSKTLLAVIIAAVFASCVSNHFYAPDKLVEVERTTSTDTLWAEKLSIGTPEDTSYYADIHRFTIVGPYAVQIGASEKGFFRVFDLRNPEKLVCFGEEGHAANEFIDAPTILHPDESADGRLLLHCADSNNNRVVSIDIEASYKEEKCVFARVQSVGEDYYYKPMVYFFNDDKLIATYHLCHTIDDYHTIFAAPKFVLNTSGGEVEKNIYPNVVSNSDHVVMAIAYSSRLLISPDKTKLVEAFSFADIMNIVDINQAQVIGVVEKSGTEGLEFFEHANNIEYYYDKLRLYSANVSLSNDYVFRSWCGGRKQSELGALYESNEFAPVDVFNYDGELLATLAQENARNDLVYSDFYDCFFAASEGNTLYKYELPQWLKKK